MMKLVLRRETNSLNSDWQPKNTNFDLTDFCHLQRRSSLLTCFFAIFGLNDNVVLFSTSIQFRPIADYDTLTVGRSARHLSSTEQNKSEWTSSGSVAVTGESSSRDVVFQ